MTEVDDLAQVSMLVQQDLSGLQDIVVASRWEPATGSPGRNALTNPVIRRGREWGQAPVHTLHTLLAMSWVAMVDHTRSAAGLLTTDVFFGSMSLARSAVEAVGRVAWVLDDGLAIDRIIERSTAVRLRSLQDSVRVTQTMARDATNEDRERLNATWNQQRNRVTDVLKQADAMRIPVHQSSDGESRGDPDGLKTAAPRSTALVLHGLDEAAVPVNVKGAVAELWSGIIHSVPWALLQFVGDVDVAEDDVAPTNFRTSASDRAYAVVLAHAGVTAAFNRLGRHFGWPIEERRTTSANVARDLASVLARLPANSST